MYLYYFVGKTSPFNLTQESSMHGFGKNYRTFKREKINRGGSGVGAVGGGH